MLAEKRLTTLVRQRIKDDIAENGGHEVLWIGYLDDDGFVGKIDTAARGNSQAVPALFPHMQKGNVVIHNHPGDNLTPSAPDLNIASMLGNYGIGFFIVNNTVTHVNVVAEPIIAEARVELNIDEIAGILEPGGQAEKVLDGYETRDSQVDMLRMVADGFNRDKIVVAEAGTGVGKSFGYLLPALSWATVNKERVVVSTGTINLQQQLMEKDIPIASGLCGFRGKTVLVKGRKNYLCRKRMLEAIEEESLFDDDSNELKAVKGWADSTKTGDLADCPFKIEERIWSRVCSEAETCGHFRCRFFPVCFAMKARKEALDAQILVVNHHLLFADLGFRISGVGFDQSAILPPFKKLIFDEAHNLEKSATSFFSQSINRFEILKYTGRFFRRIKGKKRGLLIILRRFCQNPEICDVFPEIIDRIVEAVMTMEDKTASFLQDVWSVSLNDLPLEALNQQLFPILITLRKTLLSLGQQFKELQDSIPEDSWEAPEFIEAKQIINRLMKSADLCIQITQFSEYPENVFWIEKKKLSNGTVFFQLWSTPLDISPLMNEAVFEPCPTVVCTSATLSINNNFAYWSKRVGLKYADKDRVSTGVFPSPFDYKSRVLLGIPEDIPEPGTGSEYETAITKTIKEAILVADGGALVLFTSYRLMKDIHQEMKETLRQQGLHVLKQGDDDRYRLLNQFKRTDKSVLFATSSFWEGVDMPGDALKLVIITRLPFQVPSDPVLKARMEYTERNGGNPFRDMSVPEAVIRLKQGFGRLMRRKEDRGCVMVLDSRILHKFYGRYFLESLPSSLQSIGSSSKILTDLEDFLYS